MMLERTLVDMDDHNMGEQLKERRFPPTTSDRKRTIQSPHYDLTNQQIINPLHLPELLNEINLNPKIALFEKEMLLLRLEDQCNSKTYTKADEN